MPAFKTITLTNNQHRGKKVVCFGFERDTELLDLLRKTCTVRWSATKTCWYTEAEGFDLNKLLNASRGKAWLDYQGLRNNQHGAFASSQLEASKQQYDLPLLKSALTAHVCTQLDEFRVWMEQKRYAENSIKTYLHQLEIFFGFYANKVPEQITNDDITRFNSEFR